MPHVSVMILNSTPLFSSINTGKGFHYKFIITSTHGLKILEQLKHGINSAHDTGQTTMCITKTLTSAIHRILWWKCYVFLTVVIYLPYVFFFHFELSINNHFFPADSIIFPEVPIALRLSSHLMLGVVRIYSRKVNYLFHDCSEALLKIKQAFRSTAVDLPPEESTAPYHSITLPETFHLDDFELPEAAFQG